MKKIFKMILKRVIWLVLHIIWIVPVKQKKMFFSSFHGTKYSCNPKYLYEYLVHNNVVSQYKIVWELSTLPTENLILAHSKVVPPKTFCSIIHCMTSKYIITNHEFPWYIPLRKEQFLVETWHGGGAYKKVGLAVQWGAREDKEQKLNSKQITYYLSSCEKFTEVQSVSKLVDTKRFLNTGMPRNSIFFTSHPELKEKVFSTLGILDSSTKLVIYAPTYRGTPSFVDNEIHEGLLETIDVNGLIGALKKKFGGNWICGYRSHYYRKSSFSSQKLNLINATDYDDMQELLYAADVLITDYSSSIWDFSLTGKPMFLYAPDYRDYKVERDFYTAIEEWPASLAISNEELWQNIANFDVDKHNKKCKEHLNFLGSYENCNSCKLVWEFVGVE